MLGNMNKLITIIVIFSALCLLSPPSIADIPAGHQEDVTSKVYDVEGNYIFSTARRLTAGDRYLSQDNREYVINEVDDSRATAEFVGVVDLNKAAGASGKSPLPLVTEKPKLVAIYHTHNGESYPPGPENTEGKGDIHHIGSRLAEALEDKGIKALHSENMHLPHDGAAYTRSRGTAVQLARRQPDIILDLHRDAIPDKRDYLTTINGKQVTQVRLVIGRQNPNRETNDQFARNLKAISDKKYPGLIKDIFYGSGEYNQSISPRALLMEFGTHTNSENEALRAADFTALTLADLLYSRETGQPREDSKAWNSIFWILLFTGTGILGFLYMNEGNWQGVVARIKKFFGRELID